MYNLKTERCSWLDVLKGNGIFCVVLGHIYSNQVIYNWLYSFHMPLFFLAAGWVYKEKPIVKDVSRRLQTIIIPYFSFGFLLLIYWQLVERRFRNSDMKFLDAVIGLFSGQYEHLDFNVHLWFLPCFFLTVAIFNIFVRVEDRYFPTSRKITYWIIFLMSVVCVIAPIPPMIWGLDRVFKYTGFYAIGSVFSKNKIDSHLLNQNRKTCLIEASCLLIINFVLAFNILNVGVMWYVTALSGVCGVSIIALLIKKHTVLQYLGRTSLVILCVHGPIYRVIVKMISVLIHMSTEDVRNHCIYALIVTALTIVISCLVYECLSRIAPWIVGKNKRR